MSFARKTVVFDTSSLIPACLNPQREPAHIFRQTLLAHHIAVSAETFAELAAVLMRDKFNAWRPIEQRMLWLKAFRDAAVFVPVTQTVSDCRDPKDNPFLALALAAQANVLVSSDIHLLEMHPYQGIPILRLSDFKARMLSE